MKLARPSKRDIILAIVFYALNMFDTVCTAITVTSGRVAEANPLMRALIDKDVRLFIAFKVIVPLVLTPMLLFLPTPRKVNAILLFVTGMYTMLAIVHLLIIWSVNG